MVKLINVKRKLFFLILIILGSLLPAREISGTTDLSLTLKELNEKVLLNRISEINPDTILVMRGSVAKRQVINADKETFRGEIELLRGEWVDISRVEDYRCIIIVEGPYFSDTIPARYTRSQQQGEIPLNAEVIFSCRFSGTRRVEGKILPVLKALDYRILY